jgi:hypothetical protein
LHVICEYIQRKMTSGLNSAQKPLIIKRLDHPSSLVGSSSMFTILSSSFNSFASSHQWYLQFVTSNIDIG